LTEGASVHQSPKSLIQNEMQRKTPGTLETVLRTGNRNCFLENRVSGNLSELNISTTWSPQWCCNISETFVFHYFDTARFFPARGVLLRFSIKVTPNKEETLK